jgi:hypothetical protein
MRSPWRPDTVDHCRIPKLNVTIGQGVAQVPADRDDDDVEREAEADEADRGMTAGVVEFSDEQSPFTADATAPVGVLGCRSLRGTATGWCLHRARSLLARASSSLPAGSVELASFRIWPTSLGRVD